VSFLGSEARNRGGRTLVLFEAETSLGRLARTGACIGSPQPGSTARDRADGRASGASASRVMAKRSYRISGENSAAHALTRSSETDRVNYVQT